MDWHTSYPPGYRPPNGIVPNQVGNRPKPVVPFQNRIGNRPFPFVGIGPPTYGTDLQRAIRPLEALTTDKAIYTIVKVIDSPSNVKDKMSDGIRLIRHPKGVLRVEKRLRMDTESRRERAKAEKEALMQIAAAGGSPHINLIYEAFWPNQASHCSLILEYCDQQTLDEYLTARVHSNTLVHEAFCWHVLYQLCAALSMCHFGVRDPLNPQFKIENWNTICHLDIKPGNVFLSSAPAPGREDDGEPRVVLGDFGCAVTKQDIMTRQVDNNVQPYGTTGWFPPELVPTPDGSYVGKYGKQTDIWQMGGLIQVMSRLVQYPDMGLAEQNQPCGIAYSADLNVAVTKCMLRDVKLRPTAVDAAKGVKDLMEKRGLWRDF